MKNLQAKLWDVSQAIYSRIGEHRKVCTTCQHFDLEDWEEPCSGCERNYPLQWEPASREVQIKAAIAALEDVLDNISPISAEVELIGLAVGVLEELADEKQ